MNKSRVDSFVFHRLIILIAIVFTITACGGGSSSDSTPAATWSGTKQLGVASATTYGYGVATDSSDNVFVAGQTNGGLDGNTVTGSWDFFVTKYDSTGTKQGTEQLGAATANTNGQSVATDSSGNVFVVGYTWGNLDGNTLTGTQDFFVTKYDSTGTKQWTQQLGTASANTLGRGVATDGSGNVFVTGYTGGGLDGNTLTGSSYDFFVTKYNSSGAKQWTKQLGVASANTIGTGVATDSSGNVFVAGYTGGGLDGNTKTGINDFFVTKYNSSGTKQWTKQLGVASASTYGYGVATDGSGSIFVAGRTAGDLDSQTLTGISDFFVTKYDSSGAKLWTKLLGTASADTQGRGVSTDSSGAVFVAGDTDGGLDGNTLTGTWDFFVTKYDSTGTKQWTKQLGTASATTIGYGVATDGSGSVFVAGWTDGGLDGNTLTGTRDFFVTKYDSSGTKQ